MESAYLPRSSPTYHGVRLSITEFTHLPRSPPTYHGLGLPTTEYTHLPLSPPTYHGVHPPTTESGATDVMVQISVNRFFTGIDTFHRVPVVSMAFTHVTYASRCLAAARRLAWLSIPVTVGNGDREVVCLGSGSDTTTGEQPLVITLRLILPYWPNGSDGGCMCWPNGSN